MLRRLVVVICNKGNNNRAGRNTLNVGANVWRIQNRYLQVLSWGNSIDGQLGHGDQSPRHVPTPISALDGINVKLLACSETTSFACYEKNGVKSLSGWGSNQFGILTFDEEDPPIPSPSKIEIEKYIGDIPIKQIVCGKSHVMALLENGKVFTWGNGVHGQLGTGGAPDVKLPACITSFKDKKVVKCASGTAHSMCITEDGKLYTWGNSHFSQLGHADLFNESMPREVKLDILKGRKVVDIGGGLYHTVILTGMKYLAGEETMMASVAKQVRQCRKVVDPGIINTSHIRREKIASVHCGLFHTLLLTENGKVISFGSNKSGQLGNEPRESPTRSLPKVIDSLADTPVSTICCGGFHSLAASGKSTFGWGENADYQLGIGNTRTSAYTPVPIPGLAGLPVLQLAAGMGHSLVLLADK